MKDLRYNIQLEVITPLSVGAGNENEWIKGADFIQLNNKLYVLDIKKVMEHGIDMDKLNLCFINQDEEGICRLLGNHLEKVTRYVFDLPVRTENSVKTFLRTQLYDKPIVAGSSIKGSVRSALFNSLREKERSNDEVFGKMKNGDDFMRFIKIGDIEMNRTILANTKLFNLRTDASQEWTGGWKHGFSSTSGKFKATGFNTLYECVPPGEKGIGSVIMASSAFHRLLKAKDDATPHANKKKFLMDEGARGLFKIINKVTQDYLRKERDFFTQYEADRTDDIIKCINSLLEMIPEDNSSCLMKMSAGVGFHSITGDWQFDDFTDTGFDRGKKKYKSRKIVEYEGNLMLMGFVKLTLMQEDEISEIKKNMQLSHAQQLEDIRISAQKRTEKLRHIKEEAEKKKEAERRLQAIQKEYEELISTASQLYFDNKNTEALEKAQKAGSLWPEGTGHQSLLDRISKSIEREDSQRKIEEEKRKHLAQPLSTVLAGKTSIGNILGHLSKWIKEEENSFGKEETDALAAAFLALPNKEFKKLNNSQRRIASIIGDDLSAAVFSKIAEAKT